MKPLLLYIDDLPYREKNVRKAFEGSFEVVPVIGEWPPGKFAKRIADVLAERAEGAPFNVLTDMQYRYTREGAVTEDNLGGQKLIGALSADEALAGRLRVAMIWSELAKPDNVPRDAYGTNRTQYQLGPVADFMASPSADRLAECGVFEGRFLPGELTPADVVERLTELKHNIAHLFLSVDMDIQGLVESDYDRSYFDAVVSGQAASGPARFGGLLEECLDRLYGDGDTVEAQVKRTLQLAAERNLPPARIAAAWDKVNRALGKAGDQPPSASLPRVRSLLQGLDAKDGEAVRRTLGEDRDVLHEWITELLTALDHVREAVREVARKG
jgi:hypothetical protein